MATVGILLAAGRGRRFDPSGARNKLLARLPGDVPVAVVSARSLLAVLPQVIAVVAPQDGGVADALRAIGCHVTVCADADSGMGASLVHALRHSLPDASAWIFALADMPHVAPSTIAALSDALDGGAGIAVPVCEGRRGNPVGFGAMYVQDLLALHGDEGARSLVRANPVTEVCVIDQGILRDIDIPSDL
jgi:molybdenum cofactor cytidylyltransferase